MANLFGTPGIGNDNNTSNRIPLRYNLNFLDDIGTPLQLVAQALGNPNQPVISAQTATTVVQTDVLRNATADVLRDVKKPKTFDPRKREIPTTLPDGTTVAENSEILSAVQENTQATSRINNITNLPFFSEPSPGIYSGRLVNALTQPQDVGIEVDTQKNIFGGPFTQAIPKRLSQLNGFGYGVNTNIYNANPRAVGTPLRPIIENNFYVRYGTANGSPNVGRINQESGTASTGYPGLIGYNNLNGVWPQPSTGPWPQTQGLSLYINNMPGRILYLTRRKEPYYFHLPFTSEYAALGSNLPPNVNLNALDTLGGMYFTRDPAGGGPWNDINIINGQASPPPILPNAPYILYPGGTIQIVVDNTWPDVCYYQSTSGPFMGGTVLVVGSYNYI
jgi:hypothetical protein